MSARDDATSPPIPARPPRAWRGPAVALLVGAFLGAALVGALVERHAPDHFPRYEARVRWQGGAPAAAEWPRPARPGERAAVVSDDGTAWLAVRSFSAAGTEALARDLQRRRLSGVEASSAHRAAVRARWRADRVPDGPLPPAPAVRSAALVRARLLLLALDDPRVPAVPPASSPASDAARARLARAGDQVVRLALAVQPDSLAVALAACAAAESGWLRAMAAEPAADPRARLASAWRWHGRSWAPALDQAERTLEAGMWKSQRDAVVNLAFERALALERLAPDPAALALAGGTWTPAPQALPVARSWALLLGGGALAGAALGLVACLPWMRRRSRSGAGRAPAGRGLLDREAYADRLSREPRQAWDAELGWLHVVSGPDAGRIARAVATLAGGFVERGERVLLVDAGRRLRLHERYGADTRWGLGECLAGEVPLLGAVQATGRPGFFFLAHGAPGLAGRWDSLSGLLEDAQAHFGRVLLALDRQAPREAALPLGGRVLEAWWSEPGPDLPRAAVALSERIGIPFACFDLDWLAQDTLEAGEMLALRAEDAPADAPEPAPQAEPLAVFAVEPCEEQAPAGSEAAPEPVAVAGAVASDRGEAVVLDCDVEVRERLRFLLWMRRMQAERQATALVTDAGR
jgi:hypothetical protein